MKTLAAVLVLVVAASSFGAVVDFGSVVKFDKAAPVVLPVTVTTAAPVNAVDLIFQSATAPLDGKFAFGSVAFTTKGDQGNFQLTGAANEDWVTMNVATAGTYFASPLAVGSLNLGVLPEGFYTITVDGASDGISGVNMASGFDAVNGAITFQVTPEPATMALLALGGLLVARRRHA